MRPRMYYDDVAWGKAEEIQDYWPLQFLEDDVLVPVGNFMLRHNDSKEAVEIMYLPLGSTNVGLRMRYQHGSTVLRIALPGGTMFPEEKIRNEVAVLRYLHDQTSVPVPFVLHWGSKAHSPLELGPFILTDYIENDRCMYYALVTPGTPVQERGRLDPNIDETKLDTMYGEMASVLLQLSRLSFARIGSLCQIDDFTWEVAARPLSMHMNQLVRVGTLPQSKLPSQETTFSTASAYFKTLAELHIAHLKAQRNDSVHSDDDCRRKYIARHLFRRLAHEQKLTTRCKALDQGPFPLWCDDFRPGNVLVKEDCTLAGVIDWEFSYAAPVEFSYAPPWWLLIEKPELWPDGLDAWCREFEPRLQTFLRVLVIREDEAIQQGRLQDSQRLSGPMRESWESGDFWIAYAARASFAFDAIYWHKIDQRFFGPIQGGDVDEAWKERLGLLDEQEKAEMEALVVQKQEMAQTRELAWDPDEYTLEHLDIAEIYALKHARNTEEEQRQECIRQLGSLSITTGEEGGLDGDNASQGESGVAHPEQEPSVLT